MTHKQHKQFFIACAAYVAIYLQQKQFWTYTKEINYIDKQLSMSNSCSLAIISSAEVIILYTWNNKYRCKLENLK